MDDVNDGGTILLTLDGAAGEIAAKGLQNALAHLMVLLRDAGQILGIAAGNWTISRLELGSVIIELENPAAVGVPAVIDRGLAELSEHAARPEGWTLAMLRSARELGRLAGHFGIHQVRIDAGRERAISGTIAANADSALMAKHQALGSVRGHLDKWSKRNGHRDLGMILETGEPLAVTYSDEIAATVLGLLDREVEAWGLIERNAAGQRIRLKLEGLQESTPRGRAVPIHEVAGLYAELFPGLTVADIIDEVRRDG